MGKRGRKKSGIIYAQFGYFGNILTPENIPGYIFRR
jgi:hypothetical protein